MPINYYDLGDVVILTGIFTDRVTGAGLDPGTITFKIEDPAGQVTTLIYGTDPEVSKIGAGQYEAAFEPTIPGNHHWKVVGGVTNKAAEESTFIVNSPAIP